MEGAQEMLTTALWNQVTFPLIKTGNDLNWHNYCQEELRIPELSFLNHCAILPEIRLGLSSCRMS